MSYLKEYLIYVARGLDVVIEQTGSVVAAVAGSEAVIVFNCPTGVIAIEGTL